MPDDTTQGSSMSGNDWASLGLGALDLYNWFGNQPPGAPTLPPVTPPGGTMSPFGSSYVDPITGKTVMLPYAMQYTPDQYREDAILAAAMGIGAGGSDQKLAQNIQATQALMSQLKAELGQTSSASAKQAINAYISQLQPQLDSLLALQGQVSSGAFAKDLQSNPMLAALDSGGMERFGNQVATNELTAAQAASQDNIARRGLGSSTVSEQSRAQARQALAQQEQANHLWAIQTATGNRFNLLSYLKGSDAQRYSQFMGTLGASNNMTGLGSQIGGAYTGSVNDRNAAQAALQNQNAWAKYYAQQGNKTGATNDIAKLLAQFMAASGKGGPGAGGSAGSGGGGPAFDVGKALKNLFSGGTANGVPVAGQNGSPNLAASGSTYKDPMGNTYDPAKGTVTDAYGNVYSMSTGQMVGSAGMGGTDYSGTGGAYDPNGWGTTPYDASSGMGGSDYSGWDPNYQWQDNSSFDQGSSDPYSNWGSDYTWQDNSSFGDTGGGGDFSSWDPNYDWSNNSSFDSGGDTSGGSDWTTEDTSFNPYG